MQECIFPKTRLEYKHFFQIRRYVVAYIKNIERKELLILLQKENKINISLLRKLLRKMSQQQLYLRKLISGKDVKTIADFSETLRYTTLISEEIDDIISNKVLTTKFRKSFEKNVFKPISNKLKSPGNFIYPANSILQLFLVNISEITLILIGAIVVFYYSKAIFTVENVNLFPFIFTVFLILARVFINKLNIFSDITKRYKVRVTYSYDGDSKNNLSLNKNDIKDIGMKLVK